MARIKLSPIISSINGKLGNAVFQSGKSGIILREKVKPNDLKTKAQIESRNRLQAIKSTWQNLTTQERNSWEALANFMKKKQKNDATRTLSAYNLFMQSNIIRYMTDQAEISLTKLKVSTVLGYTIEIETLTTTKFELRIEVTSDTNDLHAAIYISAPKRLSANISESEVRYLYPIFSPYPTVDITNFYLEKFGVLPTNNQKVKIKIVPFMRNSGWIGKKYLQDLTF